MKNKILTAISTIMLFVPWTILPLRTFDWALESPVAEIMVYSYAAFMIFSGIFSILSYTKGKVKSKLMQVCVVINSIYGRTGRSCRRECKNRSKIYMDFTIIGTVA